MQVLEFVVLCVIFGFGHSSAPDRAHVSVPAAEPCQCILTRRDPESLRSYESAAWAAFSANPTDTRLGVNVISQYIFSTNGGTNLCPRESAAAYNQLLELFEIDLGTYQGVLFFRCAIDLLKTQQLRKRLMFALRVDNDEAGMKDAWAEFWSSVEFETQASALGHESVANRLKEKRLELQKTRSYRLSKLGHILMRNCLELALGGRISEVDLEFARVALESAYDHLDLPEDTMGLDGVLGSRVGDLIKGSEGVKKHIAILLDRFRTWRQAASPQQAPAPTGQAASAGADAGAGVGVGLSRGRSIKEAWAEIWSRDVFAELSKSESSRRGQAEKRPTDGAATGGALGMDDVVDLGAAGVVSDRAASDATTRPKNPQGPGPEPTQAAEPAQLVQPTQVAGPPHDVSSSGSSSSAWTREEFEADNEYMTVVLQAEEFLRWLDGDVTVRADAPQRSPEPRAATGAAPAAPVADDHSSAGRFSYVRTAMVMARSIASRFELDLGTSEGRQGYWRVARVLQSPALMEKLRDLARKQAGKAAWISWLDDQAQTEQCLRGLVASVSGAGRSGTGLSDVRCSIQTPLVGMSYYQRGGTQFNGSGLAEKRVQHMRQFLSRLGLDGSILSGSASAPDRARPVDLNFAAVVVKALVESFSIDLLTEEGRDEYWRVVVAMDSDDLRPVVARMTDLASRAIYNQGLISPQHDQVSVWRTFFGQWAQRRPIRQVLLYHVSCLSRGRMPDEEAEVAVAALEEALETNANSWDGHALIVGLMEGHQKRNTNLLVPLVEFSGNTQSSKTAGASKTAGSSKTVEASKTVEPSTWSMDLAHALAVTPAGRLADLWREALKLSSWDELLQDLAKAQLREVIVAARSQVALQDGTGSALVGTTQSGTMGQGGTVTQTHHSAVTQGDAVTDVEVEGAFDSLASVFGLKYYASIERSPLRTLKVRKRFRKVLVLLGSHPQALMQARAMGRVVYLNQHPYATDWKGIYYSEAFDSIVDESGFSSATFRGMTLGWNAFGLERLMSKSSVSEVINKSVGACLADLSTISGPAFRVPASPGEARSFVGALWNTLWIKLRYSEPDCARHFPALYELAIGELQKPEWRSKVVLLRSLPLTAWFDNWRRLFESEGFKGVRDSIQGLVDDEKRDAEESAKWRQEAEQQKREEAARLRELQAAQERDEALRIKREKKAAREREEESKRQLEADRARKEQEELAKKREQELAEIRAAELKEQELEELAEWRAAGGLGLGDFELWRHDRRNRMRIQELTGCREREAVLARERELALLRDEAPRRAAAAKRDEERRLREEQEKRRDDEWAKQRAEWDMKQREWDQERAKVDRERIEADRERAEADRIRAEADRLRDMYAQRGGKSAEPHAASRVTDPRSRVGTSSVGGNSSRGERATGPSPQRPGRPAPTLDGQSILDKLPEIDPRHLGSFEYDPLEDPLTLSHSLRLNDLSHEDMDTGPLTPRKRSPEDLDEQWHDAREEWHNARETAPRDGPAPRGGPEDAAAAEFGGVGRHRNPGLPDLTSNDRFLDEIGLPEIRVPEGDDEEDNELS